MNAYPALKKGRAYYLFLRSSPPAEFRSICIDPTLEKIAHFQSDSNSFSLSRIPASFTPPEDPRGVSDEWLFAPIILAAGNQTPSGGFIGIELWSGSLHVIKTGSRRCYKVCVCSLLDRESCRDHAGAVVKQPLRAAFFITR